MKKKEVDYVMKHSMDGVKGFKKSKNAKSWLTALEAFVLVYLVCSLLWAANWKFLTDRNPYLLGAGISWLILGIVFWLNDKTKKEVKK